MQVKVFLNRSLDVVSISQEMSIFVRHRDVISIVVIWIQNISKREKLIYLQHFCLVVYFQNYLIAIFSRSDDIHLTLWVINSLHCLNTGEIDVADRQNLHVLICHYFSIQKIMKSNK